MFTRLLLNFSRHKIQNMHPMFQQSLQDIKAICSIKALEEIATILGPEEVVFHSMDDKAKVPIGITAAGKQTPLLMHMEYQVTLPDYEFVVGSRHKLIPSVVGDMKVVKSKHLTNDGVTYSGPTYIAIRSAKHSGSSTFHHLQDMNRARSLPEFTESFQNQQSKEKKVMILTVDGGPDENHDIQTPSAAPSSIFVSTTWMRTSLLQMHLGEVLLIEWKDECQISAKN